MCDQKTADNLIQTIADISSDDEETRRSAVIALSSHPLEKTREYLFRAMGDLSWRVRKEAEEVFLSSPGAGDNIEQVFDLLRSQDNAGLRNSAAEALVRLGKRSIPVLMKHWPDDDRDVRKYVVDILGGIGDPVAFPVLRSALDDDDPNVGVAAAENLGRLGDGQSIQPLLDALGKPDITLKYTILEALARMGRPVPLGLLTPYLGDNLLKKAVYDCLGSVGGEEALSFLLKGLADPAKGAREAAARALVKVLDRLPQGFDTSRYDAMLRGLAGTHVIDGLIPLLSGEDMDLQKVIIRVLGLIGDKSAVGHILRACGSERLFMECAHALREMDVVTASFLKDEFAVAHERERANILRICGELGLQDIQPLLRAGMNDSSPQVREAAAGAVGWSGQTALIPETVALLKDFDQDVRMSAIEALAALAGSDGASVSAVAEALSSESDPDKRRSAAFLYGVLRDRERLAILIKDEDDLVRRTAVQGLSGLPCDDTVHHLTIALTDESPEVRIAAAAALGVSGRDDVIDALVLVAHDNDPLVSCAALRSLGRIGGGRALAEIESVLDGADGLVALAALDALANFDDERSSQLARRATSSDDADVVKAAVDILAERDDPWLDDHAEELLNHRHWDVRNTIVRFLVGRRGRGAVNCLRHALEKEDDALVRGRIIELLEAIT